MLALVVADRHAIGAVEEDVARHQDRVREEPRGDELARLRLVLELRHPPELAEARDRRQQPARLGVRPHVALREDRRAVGVEPRREEHREEVERAVVQVLRVVVDRDRVQVDDAEERLAELLRLRVLAEAADVVAEVLVARRLDAREDPHPSCPFDRRATEELAELRAARGVHGRGHTPVERQAVERGHPTVLAVLQGSVKTRPDTLAAWP